MNTNRRRCASLTLTGAFLAAGLLGLPAAQANGSIAPPQTLAVSPPTVTAGSPTALTLTYQTSLKSEVKGTIILTVPDHWSGTPSIDASGCAQAGCQIGNPDVSGNTVTMLNSVLPPGQEFQIIYDNAIPPGSPGKSYFSVTGNGGAVSAAVTVVCANGTGTMSVSPSTVNAGTTSALTFTYTAAGCGLLSGSEVSLEVPVGWSLPSPAAGGVIASAGTVTVSGRQITITGATLPPGGDLTLRYAATAPAAPGTDGFPASEQTAAGGTLTQLASSPEISVLPTVTNSPGDGSGNLGSTGNQTGSRGGGGTPPHHRHPKPPPHRRKGSRPSRHPSHGAWPLAVLVAAVLLAAAVVGTASTLRRFRGRSRPWPGSGVGAVPNLGPVRAPAIRTRPGQAALVVRVEPHPGTLLHDTRR